MMITSIAWKNVGRNRKRSLIVMAAVLLGTTAGVFTSGLIIGWSNQRIQSAIYTEASHLKLYNPEFLNNEDIDKVVPESPKIAQYLTNNPAVKAFSQRIKLMTMASTSRGTTALMLNGVDLKHEEQVSDVCQHIIAGSGGYLEANSVNAIVISDKTAEQLRVKSYLLTGTLLDSLQQWGVSEKVIAKLRPATDIRFNTKKLYERKMRELLSRKDIARYGAQITQASIHYRLRSKILFTITDKSGELVYQTYRVCGVYKTSNTMFDQTNAYVLKKDLAPIAGLSPNDCHEIGILLHKGFEPETLQQDLRKRFPQITALNWKELLPDAGMLVEYMDLYNYIIMGFILFALAFGIINTMMMAILERTKELGMLMAIGMNHKRIFSMIMLETIFLTLAGAVSGMLVGWLVIVITGYTGLDFSAVGEGFEAMGWSAIVYPEITVGFFFGTTLLVVLTGILSSIAPARKALKMNPVEALRTDN